MRLSCSTRSFARRSALRNAIRRTANSARDLLLPRLISGRDRRHGPRHRDAGGGGVTPPASTPRTSWSSSPRSSSSRSSAGSTSTRTTRPSDRRHARSGQQVRGLPRSASARSDRAAQPGHAGEAIEQAVTEITKPRPCMHYARANQEIHALLRDRVEVSVRQPDGTTLPEKLVGHRLGEPGEQRLPARLAALGPLRPLPPAHRPRRLRQRHPARLHRAEGVAPQPQARLRRQPA